MAKTCDLDTQDVLARNLQSRLPHPQWTDQLASQMTHPEKNSNFHQSHVWIGLVISCHYALVSFASTAKEYFEAAPAAQWLAHRTFGFESQHSHVGFFSPGRLLPRAGSAMGPKEPHSRASLTSRMCIWECCSNYLTNTPGGKRRRNILMLPSKNSIVMPLSPTVVRCHYRDKHCARRY